MTFGVRTLVDDYGEEVARSIADAIAGGGSLVLTGGGTAQEVYPHLGGMKHDWDAVEVAFSDERGVPPDDLASNYGMAKRLLLDAAIPGHVHRMRGEIPPEHAAVEYSAAMRPLVDKGFDVLLLGMGSDCHIAALFPGSPALASRHLAEAVERPDGMAGITLTPPALSSAKKILLIVTGESKAAAVRRAVTGDEVPEVCPVRLLADHPDATFLLDGPAASAL
ncbi:MAG: 6-phosphogluconolactonase [Actinomycetota bacterium]